MSSPRVTVAELFQAFKLLKTSALLAYSSVGDWEHPESAQQFLRAIKRAEAVIEAFQDSERKSIYLLTVMKPVDWKTLPPEQERTRDRTWGWFSNFEEVEQAVLSNATDMFENNYYNYAVIEEVQEGFTWPAKICGWYYANYEGVAEKGGPIVAKINPPDWSEGIFNWGIG